MKECWTGPVPATFPPWVFGVGAASRRSQGRIQGPAPTERGPPLARSRPAFGGAPIRCRLLAGFCDAPLLWRRRQRRHDQAHLPPDDIARLAKPARLIDGIYPCRPLLGCLTPLRVVARGSRDCHSGPDRFERGLAIHQSDRRRGIRYTPAGDPRAFRSIPAASRPPPPPSR